MTKVSLNTTGDGRQILRWREGGRQRQETLRTSRRAAERRRAEIEDRIAAGIVDASRLTLADLGATYFEDGDARWTDKTMFGYRDQWERLILPELGGYRLDQLRRSHVKRWLAGMERGGVGRAMQRKALGRLRAILSFGVEEELISVNVAASRKLMPGAPPKRPIHVSAPIDVEMMRASAIGAGHDATALQFSLGFYLGVRPGELFGLTAGAFNDGTLTIDQRRTMKVTAKRGKFSGSGGQIEHGSKTRTIRVIDVPPVVRDELREFIERAGLTADELLFPNAEGAVVTETQYGNWVRDRFNRHRIDDRATPYSMRHSAASLMFHSLGATRLALIARQLGHSPTECLKTYQHVIEGLPDDHEMISVNKIIVAARRQVRRQSSKLKAVS